VTPHGKERGSKPSLKEPNCAIPIPNPQADKHHVKVTRDKCTMALAYYNKMVDKIRKANKWMAEQDKKMALLQRELQDGRKETQEANRARQAAVEEVAESNAIVEDFTRQVVELKRQNENLTNALEGARQALKDAGKHSKKEERRDIKLATSAWIKNVGFRDTKFVKGKKLELFAKRIYKSIAPKLDLTAEGTDHYTPEAEFVRVYKDHIQKVLGERRQYVQTQLFQCLMSECWCTFRND
jgi:ribosomal protein L16 Arg81 hydroxylase